MPNENCLIGFKCPKCGQESKFYITALTTFAVTDDGTEESEGAVWNDDSPCWCVPSCGYKGTVRDFQVYVTVDRVAALAPIPGHCLITHAVEDAAKGLLKNWRDLEAESPEKVRWAAVNDLGEVIAALTEWQRQIALLAKNGD